MKERNRIEVVQRFMDGSLTVTEASHVLGRSIRQIYRLQGRFREFGIEGLIHGNKGLRSSLRVNDQLRWRIRALASGRYKDVNDTHMCELLKREEGITVSRQWLRQELRSAGIGPKRRRRGRKYRAKRERKETFGMMLQIDASEHDWLEGRGPGLVLVGAKDDAAGYLWCRFVDSESTWSYMNLMEEIFDSHGLPLSLYSDRHTIFHSPRDATIIEQLQNKRPLTQFGRAMDEFGRYIIKAHSAPAKGRIERVFGFLQDRLVVEMRLRGVKTKEEANEVLDWFVAEHNRRFTVPPRQKESVFRPAPSKYIRQRVLCLKEQRIVSKDHTISFGGLILQIPALKKFHSIAKQTVTVMQLRDGSVEISYKNKIVAKFSSESIKRMTKTVKRQINEELKLAA